MNAVNAVLLFILVCFTAVCQAEAEDISVICDEVTGSVGKEVNLTCSVSLQITDCCIIMYKFQYPESLNESVICPQSEYSCDQRNSFTCRYTPTTAITQQFRFYLQTTCGAKTTEFTLNIPGPTTPEIVTETPGKKVCTTTLTGPTTPEIVTETPGKKEEALDQKLSGTSAPDTAAGHGSRFSVIAAVLGCFILVILIIIIMTIIRNKKPNFNRSCGFQKKMFLCIRPDEDSSTRPEDVI